MAMMSWDVSADQLKRCRFAASIIYLPPRLGVSFRGYSAIEKKLYLSNGEELRLTPYPFQSKADLGDQLATLVQAGDKMVIPGEPKECRNFLNTWFGMKDRAGKAISDDYAEFRFATGLYYLPEGARTPKSIAADMIGLDPLTDGIIIRGRGEMEGYGQVVLDLYPSRDMNEVLQAFDRLKEFGDKDYSKNLEEMSHGMGN